MIPDVCKIRILSDFEFCFAYEVNTVRFQVWKDIFVHIEMCFHKLRSCTCVASLEMCCWY